MPAGIKNFGLVQGLECTPDEDGVFTLQIEDDMLLSVAPAEGNEDVFIMMAGICPVTCDPAVDQHIYRNALQLAFLGDFVQGGTVALMGGFLVLGYTVFISRCDELAFTNMVDNVAAAALEFRAKLFEKLNLPDFQKKETTLPKGMIDYA